MTARLVFGEADPRALNVPVTTCLSCRHDALDHDVAGGCVPDVPHRCSCKHCELALEPCYCENAWCPWCGGIRQECVCEEGE